MADVKTLSKLVEQEISKRHNNHIRYRIEDKLQEAIDNDWIVFESDEQKEDFISECVETVLYYEELHDERNGECHINYGDIVLDTANDCGYWKG